VGKLTGQSDVSSFQDLLTATLRDDTEDRSHLAPSELQRRLITQ
jgi:hypothetical protein